jgi:hypothetical protein
MIQKSYTYFAKPLQYVQEKVIIAQKNKIPNNIFKKNYSLKIKFIELGNVEGRNAQKATRLVPMR